MVYTCKEAFNGVEVGEPVDVSTSPFPGMFRIENSQNELTYLFHVDKPTLDEHFVLTTSCTDARNILAPLVYRATQAMISNCNHTWKKYVGFTDSFTYCEKCDKRQ